jgi:fructose-1,6-bisphosphatase
MANVKKIVRTEEFKIRMSKEEKELFFKLAENIGIAPSKLARNLMMSQAEAKIENAFLLPFIKAYKSYLKTTNQNEKLEDLQKED